MAANAQSHAPLQPGGCHLRAIDPADRNRIYEELLLYSDDDPDKSIYPQILATCGWINTQASPVLQQNLANVLLARISVSCRDNPTVRYDIQAPALIPRPERLTQEIKNFNPVSTQLQRAIVEIKVHLPLKDEYNGPDDGDTRRAFHVEENEKADVKRGKVRRQLYHIVTQILVSNNIRRLNLKVRTYSGQEQVIEDGKSGLGEWMFLPIRQLAEDVWLVVHGMDERLQALLFKPISADDACTISLGKTALWH